jgi:hypothetical protein
MKDIKFIIDEKLVMGYVNATFSERGQWDMGKEIEPKHIKAYAHFYTLGEAPGTCYDRNWHVNQSIINGKFAVAQMISEYWPYVGFAAFWPHPNFWTVDGWNVWDRSIAPLGLKQNDMVPPPTPAEPDVPYVIGEWIFTSQNPHYRVVTVYGVTDRHDADDANIGSGHSNIIDREVQYLLDEVFNPYGLKSAVMKETERCVEFFEGDGTWSFKDLKNIPVGRSLGKWDEYCSFAERVLVDGILLTPKDARIWNRTAWSWWPSFPYTYEISVTDGKATLKFYKDADGKKTTQGDTDWVIEKGKTVKVLYSIEGSAYEWVVVGRESRAVDSAGAAMVTEAFKNIGINVVLAGLDMQDMVFGSSVPWVMAKFGAGTSRPDYYYLDGTMRAALRDDHCETYPISSSNIISVGGPFANLATEYFAEFTPALGWGQFPVWSLKLAGSRVDTLMAISCWSKNEYKDTATVGYAVISAYKDINGTVGLLIYGWTGQDTYWASTWLWLKGGISELRGLSSCVTSIILKIDYSTCTPSITIAEYLGTISEITPHIDP